MGQSWTPMKGQINMPIHIMALILITCQLISLRRAVICASLRGSFRIAVEPAAQAVQVDGNSMQTARTSDYCITKSCN